MEQVRKFFGWQVLAALWVIMFINQAAVYYGGAVINAQMTKDLNLDRSILGLGVTVLLLTKGLLAPVIAWVVNRIGARLTLCYGCLVLALGALILARWVTLGWHYVVAYGLIVGGGCAFSTYVPLQACAALWFEKRRAFALSIVLAAVGVGGVVAAPLVAKIIAAADGNWRAGWYFVAGEVVFAGLVALLFVKNRPSDYGQIPDGRSAADSADAVVDGRSSKRKSVYMTADTWAVRDAAKTSVMWLMVAATLGFSIPFVSIITHLVPHLKDLGHSPAVAAASLGILAFCSIFGKLGGGFLCDRIEPRYVWTGSMLLTGVSVVIAAGATSNIEIYLLGILLGLGYGAASVCWSAMIANYFGAGAFASVLGIQFCINTTVVAAAPFLVGLAYDMQGTYVTAFYGIAAFAFATGFLMITATPPKRPSSAIIERSRSQWVRRH